MSSLVAADFDAFFGELYSGREGRPLRPFPWQRRLVRRILEEAKEGEQPGWPRVLALPTASGKTACIDIAVFTLACQAELPPESRIAPRRILFVVDRRVIVDEAYERARHLAAKLAEASGGVLGQVAAGLRTLAGSGSEEPPLAAFELRGGIYRDDAWARTPLQPTIIASTVDQVGSRLLHRGYGVSSRSWPIHAGLAANDALLILDEAHCAQPFGDTVRAIDRYRRWAEEPLPGPFAYVMMTATPRAGHDEGEVFRLEEEDRTDPELGRRLRADKPVRLLPPIPGKTGTERLVRAFCEEGKELARAGARRIAILVNRVDTARRVHERIAGRDWDTVLMTGRMRPWDRDRLLKRWRPILAAGAQHAREQQERPVFVAATQCLEVGADLDFDAMVTECASLDALRQRFGRLNRLGYDDRASGAIVVAADDVKKADEDFVYGSALRETWHWLSRTAAEEGRDDELIDFGIAAFEQSWERAMEGYPGFNERLSPPAPDAPVMLPAHLDSWCQTSPTPAPDPDPSVFLHGPDRGAPEVQVCWRLDLEVPVQQRPSWDEFLARWVNTVASMPPSSTECMPVPLHVLLRWLKGVARPEEELTDVEGGIVRSDEDEPRDGAGDRTVLRWLGPEDSELSNAAHPPLPGETVVIPAPLGGWEVFGHIPENANGLLTVDIAEASYLERRRRPALRLHTSLLELWPKSPERDRFLAIAQRSHSTTEADDVRQEVKDLLDSLIGSPELEEKAPLELHGVLPRLHEAGFDVLPHPSGGGWVLKGRKRPVPAPPLPIRTFETETFTTEDDSASATTDVPLKDHCRGVAQLAARFGEGCGLPVRVLEDLRLSGRLHDLGKADPRFQAWLHGGNDLAAQLSPVLLAKSDGLADDKVARERSRRRSGYPLGARHELLSVRLLESDSKVLQQASDPELVLHLIASHHGRCRPFAPVVIDDNPAQVKVVENGVRLTASSATGLERLDSGVGERFWRLVRRYGWWGLSLLEAIMRLADHRRSEAEELRALDQAVTTGGRETA